MVRPESTGMALTCLGKLVFLYEVANACAWAPTWLSGISATGLPSRLRPPPQWVDYHLLTASRAMPFALRLSAAREAIHGCLLCRRYPCFTQ